MWFSRSLIRMFEGSCNVSGRCQQLGNRVIESRGCSSEHVIVGLNIGLFVHGCTHSNDSFDITEKRTSGHRRFFRSTQ